MVKTETRPWDVAEHLETEEDMAAYLEAALEDGDASKQKFIPAWSDPIPGRRTTF